MPYPAIALQITVIYSAFLIKFVGIFYMQI